MTIASERFLDIFETAIKVLKDEDSPPVLIGVPDLLSIFLYSSCFHFNTNYSFVYCLFENLHAVSC